ncbi:hypothetical protein niasHS_011028 [Heterodera schachtii]|uniref:Uncharacterized protein n=1 Tax=Heterodera schachtii TaxID=97005 RepID=A0ABD2IV70_HETSC
MSSKTTTSKRGGSGSGKSTGKQSEHHHLITASTLNFFKIEDAASKGLTPENALKESAVQIASIRSSLASHSATVKKHELKDNLLINAMKLRRLNRYFNFRNNFARDRLSEARRKVEENHLSLQNLTNEITHLRKNMDVCMEFQAGDSDIELVGIDEFYASATGETNGTEVAKTDEHQLHVARLKHELNERRSMLANLQESEGRKSALLSDIRGKEQRLSQIGSKISAIKKATIPLFDVLGLKAQPSEIGDKAKQSPCPFSVQLRPLYTNEEFCREIFGTHSIELGCDALVRVTEESAGPSNGTKENAEMDETSDGKEKEPLANANSKDFFELEDELSKAENVAEKQTKATQQMDKMRTLLAMSDDGGNQNQSALSELLPIAITLRRLNRFSNLQIMAAREKMVKMRECVEKRTNELRNGHVGVDFIKKCVDLCLDFPNPSDSDIDLIPVDQFFIETNSIALPEAIRNDAHQLLVARLKHEFWTRKSLVDRVNEVEQKKKAVLEAIGAAEKALGKVNPRVDTLKKTAKPLLDIVGLKSVALSVHNREIPFRPMPIGAEAFREIFGDSGGVVAESNELNENEEEEELMELGEDEQLIC